jgi:thioredoxin reductase
MNTASKTHFDTLIVGAGPAGLQMAALLEQKGRDYLVLEGAQAAGAFFATYPRHRTLISINKVNNLYQERDFNLRHDWNSLLSDDDSLLFKHYSEDLFPAADTLVRYLNDFAAKTGVAVRYNTRVSRVRRQSDGFRVETKGGEVLTCRTLLMATGAVTENLPRDVEGIELATTYANHTLDPAAYKNKKVAILGAGNSAFEVANHLAGSAAIIHILVRHPVKHAWQTHFPGDLRAINNTIIDMYQLKSLHATIGFQPRRIVRSANGKLRVSMQEDCPHWSVPSTLYLDMEYDEVILCTGWRYVPTEIFGEDVVPELSACGRYPILSPTWESSVPGLYFIGTAMAARDKKAASPFIHGFRYNVRTLFHLLEEKHANVKLGEELGPLNTLERLQRACSKVIDRVSTSSGLYQMNGVLADVIEVRGGRARYIEELPVATISEREDLRSADFALSVSLEYGFDKYPEGMPSIDFIHPSDIYRNECSAFLHPVLRLWKGGEMVAEEHFGESLTIRYDQFITPDALGTGFEQAFRGRNENKVANFLNRELKLSAEPLPDHRFGNDVATGGFRAWSEQEIADYKAEMAAREATARPRRCKP